MELEIIDKSKFILCILRLMNVHSFFFQEKKLVEDCFDNLALFFLMRLGVNTLYSLAKRAFYRIHVQEYGDFV